MGVGIIMKKMVNLRELRKLGWEDWEDASRYIYCCYNIDISKPIELKSTTIDYDGEYRVRYYDTDGLLSDGWIHHHLVKDLEIIKKKISGKRKKKLKKRKGILRKR